MGADDFGQALKKRCTLRGNAHGSLPALSLESIESHPETHFRIRITEAVLVNFHSMCNSLDFAV